MFELLAEGLQFPESPFWSTQDKCLYLVEWFGNRVLVLRDDRLETLFSAPPGGGPSGLCQDVRGDLWVCLYDGLKVARFDRAGALLQEILDFQGRSFRGPCDMVADAWGGVFFTDSGDFEEDWRSGRLAGVVYYYHPQYGLVEIDRELRFPNGIALSEDGCILYVNEHRGNRTLSYRIPPGPDAGSVQAAHSRRVFFEYDRNCLLDSSAAFELGPDGMCVDRLGNLWVAHYGGGKVLQISPKGELLRTLHLPRGRQPTNTAITPDGSLLYITEAEHGLLYRVKTTL